MADTTEQLDDILLNLRVLALDVDRQYQQGIISTIEDRNTQDTAAVSEAKHQIEQLIVAAELRGEYNGLRRALLAEPKGIRPDFVTMMLTTCNYVTERLSELEEALKQGGEVENE